MRIVLLDLTGGATCADGSALTLVILTNLAEALSKQLNTHYSPEYGGNFSVRVGTGPADVQPGEDPFAFLRDFADAPDAIAYHQRSGNGRPLLFDAITRSDRVGGPGNSASVAASHECLEAAQNAACNLWRDLDDGTGAEVANEIGDPFENQSYGVICTNGTLVWVSNFALPSFFTPDAPGPYSYMAHAGIEVLDAPKPFEIPAGQGYMNRRAYDPASEKAVNGFVHSHVGEKRRRPLVEAGQVAPSSRKHRMGLRL